MGIRYFLRVWLLCALMVPSWQTCLFSQIKWDGGGGDGRWITAANWSGNTVPSASDQVVLDNSLRSGNYTVSLPEAAAAVTIKSLSVAPSVNHTIELILPTANHAVPAFTVTGPGYGMIINRGGVFRNSSGADSGQPVIIADSLRINNGGRYIQNSDRSHAAIVMALARAPGTEEGIFEFDIPGASNTLSLSGRQFGKLVLSSNAMPGIATYTATGVNGVIINSDLEIGEGVSLSLNLSDTLRIRRDLLQQGGVINLGNSNHNLVTVIERHLVQSSTGIMQETGTGLPEIILQGSGPQQVNCQGTLQNSIAFTINNMAGVTLNKPLSLPYSFKLQKGILQTTSTNLLTLLPGCRVRADSLSTSSFINGPVRVENTTTTRHILLPMGKDNKMGWLALKNAYGHFTTEYLKSNPQSISDSNGTGIHHISGIEYWSIQADPYPLPSAEIELSFNGPNSLSITDMNHLRIVRLQNSIWTNAGNTAVTGTAGSRGSVISDDIDNWSNSAEHFTLASTMPAGSLSLRDDGPRRNPRTKVAALRLVSISSGILTCQSPEKSHLSIMVTSIFGHLVKSSTAYVIKGVNTIFLDTQNLPAGVYCIQAFTGNRQSNVLRYVRL